MPLVPFSMILSRFVVKTGDLVRLKDSGRHALVIEVPAHLGCAKVIFIDLWEIKSTLKQNIEALDEN